MIEMPMARRGRDLIGLSPEHTSTAFDGNETCMGAVNSVLFVNDASSIFGVTER
jgi:hypothetical protein